ncbi:hypothetical protein RISK_003701 [Rhodopirellula islandica]|uniref:Uncharacterized protein n=1 Tax=Rhodopirellula islandica TaxID=595434 RepID=A0A0J1BBT5_RHOIS|nr:hypothetical protein RISK_003701 [Rhodopirellula islandica]
MLLGGESLADASGWEDDFALWHTDCVVDGRPLRFILLGPQIADEQPKPPIGSFEQLS